ncbi:hypothetical protein [Variovorax sp. YR752]|uniref:hypothetical protein n=1 Tax=Variovorax sp. YR752 TaxID=1884383 RepID=UPI003137C146
MPRHAGIARRASLIILLLLGACGGGDGEDIAQRLGRLIVAGFDRTGLALPQGSEVTLTVQMQCDRLSVGDVTVQIRAESQLGPGVSARLTGPGTATGGQSGSYPCDTATPDPQVRTGRVSVLLSAANDAALDSGSLFIYLEVPPPPFCDPSPCESPDSTRADLAFTVVPGGTGVNLLANPGFEQAVDNGPFPDAAGSWRGDLSASVPADNGITPRGGTAMLKFLATGNTGSATLVSSQQWQIVDLSAFTAQILAGRMQADASVWFHRVAGDASTDRRFDLRLLAFAGSPDELPARYAAADWLAERTTTLNTGGEDWQQALASLLLPPTTGYLLFEIYAFEDAANDATEEFAGHYADDASLVLTELNP